MKLTVKTLKGSHFEIRAQNTDTIMSIKKAIEDIQGKDNYPCGQQLLIHNGKVLKDESTLAENQISEEGFLVVMVSKSKTPSSTGASSIQAAPTTTSTSNPDVMPQAPVQPPVPTNTHSEAASNVVVDSSLEQTIEQIMDMGGGIWDRESVTRALRAAYNNPERAVDYLYSGIPETTEVAVPLTNFAANEVDIGVNPTTGGGANPAGFVSGAPNSSPLNMFPQGTLSTGGGDGHDSLDFLRNNQQFQALRSIVRGNPQILQPMLQELGKQNPELLRLIQAHHAEFLQLINEPMDDSEGDLFEDHEQDEDMPHAITVTPAEQEAIERLEAMGFEKALVIEAFLACDRNEELAINYLLEHAGDYED